MSNMASQFFAGAGAGVAVLVATVRLHVFRDPLLRPLLRTDALECRLDAQHWIDTLKLLGQLGPIDWPGIRRNPFKLYAGIAPAIIETAAYKCAAPSPPASLCAF